MADGSPLDLQQKIEALERKNKLLEEGLHQAERLRLMFDRTAQELKATKLLLIRHSAELAESEERFRKSFRYAAIGMALVGLDGRWLKANHALCQIVGYTEPELLEKTFQDITHPDDLQSDLDLVEQLLAGKIDHYQMEKRYFHKDGHVVWVRLSVSLILDAYGNPIHFVSQIEDITKDKQLKEGLRASEQKFMQFFMGVPVALGVVNNEGIITHFNHRFTQVFGYTTDDVPTIQDWWQRAYPDESYRQRVMESWGVAAAKAAKAGTDIELAGYTVTCKSGAERLTEIGGFIFGDNLLATFVDVTERKQAEEKIRQLNEELDAKVKERTQQLLQAQDELIRKEKLALLGQVAGSVGHELRNPLGVMNNAVYFLQTVLADADESTKEYLNIIKDEIAVSERIVSDLLDSVRIKPPQPEIVGVQALLEQTLHKCSVPPSVAVKLDIPATLSPLRVDALQIHQVLRNLISNGVEAMPEGGTLEIRAVEDMPSKTITVSIRDNGSGMTPEQLGHLFQPLFTTKARGIGLGLVVIKNLTQANGGTVAVQSDVGKGTVFTVTLPAGEKII
ncbi:MAG: PAS domain S-box protein [Gallionellaceae bacterium]|jgi:PAS domain S-box-containing protein